MAFIVPFDKDQRVRIERHDETNSHAVSEAKSLIFCVVLFTSHERLPINHPSFRGLQNVRMEYIDGVYRYKWEYPTFKHAKKQAEQLSDLGFRETEIDVIFKVAYVG